MDALSAFEPEVFKLPFPADFEPATYADIVQRADALLGAATAIFQQATQSGQSITISENARTISRDVFAGAYPISNIQTTAEGIHLAALLNAYDITVVQNAQQLRNFCTNILIDKAATAAKDSDRLRAVEMLGKIKDVALFEERSTVLVANMSTEQIQTALLDKVAALRSRVSNAVTVDANAQQT